MSTKESQSYFNYSFFLLSLSPSLLFLERQSCYRIFFFFFSFCLAPCRRPSCVDLVANKSMNKLYLCLFRFSISFNLSICFAFPDSLSFSIFLSLFCMFKAFGLFKQRSIILSHSFVHSFSFFSPIEAAIVLFHKSGELRSQKASQRKKGKVIQSRSNR